MTRKQCADCYFADCCEHHNVCRHYAPIGEDAETAADIDYAAALLAEFTAEWYRYISEYE